MNDLLQSDRCARAVAAALLLATAHPVWADLNNVSGLTPVQKPVAEMVQSIWNGRTRLLNPTPSQDNLIANCKKMVQTSNAQQASGIRDSDLRLNEAQLRDALQGVAPEELSAQLDQSMSSSRNAVSGRLLALRGGAQGLTLTSDRPWGDGAVASASPDFGGYPRGGGASTTPLTGPWGGFVNVNHNRGAHDRTAYENAFDFKNTGVTTGIDYRVNPRLILGGAVSYDRTDSDFEASTGDVGARGSGVLLYGSYSGANTGYVEGHFSHSRIDYDTTRNIVVPSLTAVAGINSTARGKTAGTQDTLSLGAGYEVKLGNTTTLAPFIRLEHLRAEVDGFTEVEDAGSLGLDVNAQTTRSLQSSLGARLSTTRSTGAGVLTPYVGVEWSHEFRNNSRNIVAKYTHDPFNTFFAIPTQNPDRNFFTLSFGMSAQFTGGLSGFVNLDSVQGLRDVSNTGLTLGLRQEF